MRLANGSSGHQRRQFTPEEKATILRRHLADKIAVSDLCDEYHIQPTLFYLWQRQAFEQLSAALQDGRTRRARTQAVSADRARITALEARLAKKDAIIAAVSEEYLALKKRFFGNFPEVESEQGRTAVLLKPTKGRRRTVADDEITAALGGWQPSSRITITSATQIRSVAGYASSLRRDA